MSKFQDGLSLSPQNCNSQKLAGSAAVFLYVQHSRVAANSQYAQTGLQLVRMGVPVCQNCLLTPQNNGPYRHILAYMKY